MEMGHRKLFSRVAVLAIVVLAFTLFAASSSAANGELKSYIVVMIEEPAIAYEGDVAGLPATKPGRGGKINPNSAHVQKYEKFLEERHEESLEEAGADVSQKVHDYTISLNGYSALLTEAQANAIKNQDGVTLVMEDEMRQVQTDNSPEFLGLTGPAGAHSTGYVGEDVVIGVVDTGIWPEHPSLADDGSYGSPPADFTGTGCEFGNTDFNPDDSDFTCNNKLLAAKAYNDTFDLFLAIEGGSYVPGTYDSARDEDGHGTHTSTTAAGNAGVTATILGNDLGTLSGIAPRARVSMYKACWSSTEGSGCFTSDLVDAIDTAVADGVDVINYSIGGGPSLAGADDIAFLFAADAGVFVATSAGNSGPGAATLGGPASVPWVTAVGANTQDRTFQGSAVLGDGSEYFGASVTNGVGPATLVDAEDIPAAGFTSAESELCLAGTLDPAAAAGNIVLCRRGAIARVAKSQNVMNAGGVGLILYNASDADTQNTDNHYIPSVHINNTDGLAIKAYIDAAGSGATATIVGGTFTPIPGSSMASFSSRGPNPVALDIIKPDITAPGVNILAGNTPTALLGAPGQLFQAISGTSMSSPHIAGIFALIKQAHPEWSPAMAKSAIMTTARQDVTKEDGSTPADPFDMGAGHVDPGNAVHKGSAFQPGLVYHAGFLDYLGFYCDEAPEVVGSGTCGILESIGVPTDARNLNLPSIGIADVPGVYTVQRTVTSVAQEEGWRTYNVSVEAPAGYDVSVEPSTLRLKNGDSATYAVTFTNVSAPVGEWRFGSLTWSDDTGQYDVRSPIAVRGALLSAPGEVTGSGESGSVSFDVTFGYTGDYAATAHGLEPATLTMDTVVQDPDQDFDPNDGFSNLHQFSLTDVAFFRIAMPPEATEADADLDIFVYNPSGQQVASSTSGGTNEEINIEAPADGTWSVFVHGWAAPGGDSPYTMYSWAISETPGGNLTIDSAPTSATLSQTGTIEASWSGAADGQWHLGAVGHSDASGIIGLTLVEVDNR